MSGQEGQRGGERQGRQACLQGSPVPHHVSAEWFRGGWLWTTWGFVLSGTRSPGESLWPKAGPASLYFSETASPVLLSLNSVLTSGAPGSLLTSPRLSGPLGLGPEEVPRVRCEDKLRSLAGTGAGPLEGLVSQQRSGVWGWQPTAGSSALPATSVARPGRGLGSPAALRGNAPHPAAQDPGSRRGPEPTAAQVSCSPKPCPRALDPMPPGWGRG